MEVTRLKDAVMIGLTLFSFIVLIEINQSTAEGNISKCYASYCYFWNGNLYSSQLPRPCPEAHWTLEIYDEGVQSEVLEFISSIHGNNKTIVGHFVLLNLSCKNSTTCTWKHTNRTASYFNWEKGVDWDEEDDIHYFQTSNEPKKWTRIGKINEYPFAKLCMKTNQIEKINQTFEMKYSATAITSSHEAATRASIFKNLAKATATTSSHEAATRTSSLKNLAKDDGDNLYGAVILTVVGLSLVVLIGVVVLVALTRRLRKGAMTSSSSSSTKSRANTASVNHKIAQQFSSESGKPIYAEVPKGAEEGNSNQHQPSIQYADLNWSTNISKVEQNESKPVKDQRRNYFGPMGDVYARIQKG